MLNCHLLILLLLLLIVIINYTLFADTRATRPLTGTMGMAEVEPL